MSGRKWCALGSQQAKTAQHLLISQHPPSPHQAQRCVKQVPVQVLNNLQVLLSNLENRMAYIQTSKAKEGANSTNQSQFYPSGVGHYYVRNQKSVGVPIKYRTSRIHGHLL